MSQALVPPTAFAKWVRAWLGSDARAGTFAAAFCAAGLLVVVGLYTYLQPEGIRAPMTVKDMSTQFKSLATAQETNHRISQTYLDPAPLFRRTAALAGMSDVVVENAYADQNHWFLRVRSARAGTICSQMVELRDGGNPPPPSCRKIDARDH